MRYLDLSTGDEFSAQAAVLERLQTRASSLNIGMIVVGAVARTLLITGVTGAQPERVTADIDVAVAVDSWADFEKLTAPFPRDAKIHHRFTILGIKVDVVPFGGVETARREIVWPDESILDVVGFREALQSAVTVRLPGVEVQVASLPAQVILKLFAWRDRHLSTTRDALDIRSILRSYSAGPYLDALYDNHLDILSRQDFDPVLAGCEWMGSEAIRLLYAGNRDGLLTMVKTECDEEGLLPAQMGGRVGENRRLLEALLKGMTRGTAML